MLGSNRRAIIAAVQFHVPCQWATTYQGAKRRRGKNNNNNNNIGPTHFDLGRNDLAQGDGPLRTIGAHRQAHRYDAPGM
jgi:hypothetical protein